MILPGDSKNLSVIFQKFGVNDDPETSVVLVLTLPDLSVVTYTYEIDSEITRKDIGEYEADFVIPNLASSIGTWLLEWTGTDPEYVQTIDGFFEVEDVPDTVTMTVEDQDSNAVSGAFVEIRDSSDKIVFGGSTNASGVVVTKLKDGDYAAHISKVGFRFSESYSFTVSGVTTPSAFVGEDLQVRVTPTVSKCRLYGFIRLPDGSPAPSTTILVTTVGGRLVGTGAVGLDPESVGVQKTTKQLVTRKADGYWETDLVQGSQVDLSIPSMGYHKLFRVPEQDSLNFADIRNNLPPYRSSERGGTPQTF